MLVGLEDGANPFATVFDSGRARIINTEYTRSGDPFFGHEMAMLLPLAWRGDVFGVLGLWQRSVKAKSFRVQDRELGMTLASHLSAEIHGDRDKYLE